MSAENRFSSAWLKIERARRHICELHHLLFEFQNADFHKLWVDEHTETGSYILRYEALSLPDEVPLIIGDAIHNLHVPFDHIASQIARDAGNDGNRVHFPKHEKKDDVARSRDLINIAKTAPRLKEVILDTLCPFKGGPFYIWELGKLDNMDKHKLLVPTVSISYLENISAVDLRENTLEIGRLRVDAGGRINLANFGSPLRITRAGTPGFSIDFASGTFFDQQPVMYTMVNLLSRVSGAVSHLEKEYFYAAT